MRRIVSNLLLTASTIAGTLAWLGAAYMGLVVFVMMLPMFLLAIAGGGQSVRAIMSDLLATPLKVSITSGAIAVLALSLSYIVDGGRYHRRGKPR